MSELDLQRKLAILLAAARRAHISARQISAPEMEEINHCRASAGRAALAYSDRTGCDTSLFDRALLDGDLEGEGLISALLDIAEAVSKEVHEDQIPELLRTQADEIVRMAIRFSKHWCEFKGFKPRDVNGRLADPDLSKEK